MPLIALGLQKNKDFVINFELYKFQIDIKEISHLRNNVFPELYAQSLFIQDKRNQILSHHQNDLRVIKDIIKSKYSLMPVSIEGEQVDDKGIGISIISVQGETFSSPDYKYLYVFMRGNNCPQSLKEIINNSFSINNFYADEGAKVTILDSNLNFTNKINSKVDPRGISLEKICQDKLCEYKELENQQQILEKDIRSIATIDQSSKAHESGNIDHLIINLSKKDLSDLNLVDHKTALEKIVSTGAITNKVEVTNATLLIANKLAIKDLTQDFLGNIISYSDQTNAVLECLNRQQNLEINQTIEQFLFKQLNNEMINARQVSYELLKLSKTLPNIIKEAIELEDKIKLGRDIINDCQLIVNKGGMLTYNCFATLAKKLNDEKVQNILQQVIDLDRQKIPNVIIDQYKSLFKNQVVKLTANLSRAGYINLEGIGDIKSLISSKETKDQIFELLRYHVNKGNKLSEAIISEVAAQARENNPLAINILRLINGIKDDIDKLKDHSLAIKDRLQALNRIALDKKYHNVNTTEILESLIKYEPTLRYAAIKTLIEILPEGYTKKGYSNLILNNIVNYIYHLDIVTINKLVDKDHSANLIGITNLVIDKIDADQFKEDGVDLLVKLYAFGNKQLSDKQSLMLLLKQDNAIDRNIQKTEQEIFVLEQSIRDQIPYLSNIALSNSSTSVRNSIIEIIKNNAPSAEIDKRTFSDQLEDLRLYTTLAIESGKNLDELKEAVIKGYVATNQQINTLINLLDSKEQVNVSEILLITAIRYGLTDKEFDSIWSKILDTPEMLEKTYIIDIINIGTNRLNKGIIELLENTKFDKDTEVKVTCILSSLDREIINSNTLTRISKCLIIGELDAQIHLAQGLLNQIEKTTRISSVPKEVIENIRAVALKPRDGSDKNDLLSQITFKSLYKTTFSAPKDFISKYYANLRSRIGDEKNTELVALDKYIGGGVADKNKHRLINAINQSLINRKELDSSIFQEFSSVEWEKEILASALLARGIQYSNKEVNEFELNIFRERINALDETDTNEGIGIFEITKKEDILHELINKQSAEHLDLNDINDLMGYIGNNSYALSILKNNNHWQELPRLWIINKLPNLQIAEKLDINSLAIKDLASLITPYKHIIIDQVLTRLNNKNNNIQDIVELFTLTRQSGLSIESQEYFLTDKVKSRASDCKVALAGSVVNALLSSKYRNNSSVYQLEGISNNRAIEIADQSLLKNVETKLTKLLLNGWGLNSLTKLINKVQNIQNLQELDQVLTPIYEYSLREYDTNTQEEQLIDLITKNDFQHLSSTIHALAISHSFSISKEKDFTELLKELKEKNPNIPYIDELLKEYEKVINCYNSDKNSSDTLISSWDTDKVLKWANQVKQKSHKPDIYEKLAVIKRAIEVDSKERGKEISPRPIQLMSVLIMLNAKNDKGRLAQINTGEGKTTIVAMLAVMKALEGDGHKVDIITSSSELARPQSKEQKSFFKKFNLSVAHNGKDEDVDIKERYKSDIVYGAAGDFQGDILRDEYNKLGTRSGRICDIAIVDEVDSMLIDGKNHIVMLSSPMPAMDYLEPVLASIWIQIEAASQSITDIDGKSYYIDSSDAIGNDGKMIKGQEMLYPLGGTKEAFLKTSAENYIRRVLRDGNLTEDIPSDYPKLEVPKHLKDFILKTQLSKWVDSAIYAKYRCELGKHYILKNNKVASVDASNTGVVQDSMHWSNGLHQFLQIKHGTKISAESLATNFISNVTYFQRYGSNIYGLTGTLGSKKAKELLNETYSVDSVVIPTFKQKQYKELEPIITDNENDWYEKIIDSCLNKLNNNRAVLVISKYINETSKLESILKSRGYPENKIKMYKTEENSKEIEGELKSGEIILATNIAGRGTDIIPSIQVEANGGLHVCITFLPTNERVEQQNVGRTSRTGNKGTAQFVLLDNNHINISTLRAVRDIAEKANLEKAKTQIEKVIIKDVLFKEFCNLLSEIHPESNKPQEITSINSESLIIRERIRAIEEKFGLWLKLQEDLLEKSSKEKALKHFQDFKQEMKNIWTNLNHNQEAQINPIFHVLIGNLRIDQERYEEAISEFSKAIKLDPYFAANAYYSRGYARIAKYGNASQSDYDREIPQAIDDFKKAREIIEQHLEPMLHLIQRAVVNNDGTNITPVSEQVQHKLTLYGVQKNTIDTAIGVSNAGVDKEISDLEQKLSKIDDSKTKDAIEKQIKYLKENRAERAQGVIGQAKEKNYGLKIETMKIEEALPEDQDINLYQEEITEYRNNGFKGSFRVTEIKPVDWWSVGVALIGLCQLVGGAALAVFTLGAGSSIGMGLMVEGVSDLIAAVKDGIINRDFNWESWSIQKSISMTISLVCAGLGAIKDAAKTTIAGTKVALSSGTKVATQTVKEGWKLAAKAMGTAIGKGVAKEMVNQLVDYGINKAVIPEIEQGIKHNIEPKIQAALLANINVKKLLELDAQNRNNYYQSLIKKKAHELMHKEKTLWVSIAEQIATGIAEGKLAASNNKYAKIGAYVKKAFDAGKAVHDLIIFVDKFNLALEKEINKITSDVKVDKNLQQKQERNNPEPNKTELSITGQRANIQVGNFDKEANSTDIEDQIGKGKIKEEHQVSSSVINKTPEELTTSLSSSVAINMSNIIQSKLIKPATGMAVNWGVNHLSKDIDKSIQEQVGNYQAERRMKFQQDERVYRIPDKLQKRAEDPAYQAKADKIIKDLENGGEAGVMHMGAVSEVINAPIKVYDKSGKLLEVIGAEKNGTPVEVRYVKPSADNLNGHFTLNKKDANGKYIEASVSDKNNCLFDVVSAQLPDNHTLKGHGAQLRNDTVAKMNSVESRKKLAAIAPDIVRLEQYKKDALTMGGAKVKVYDNSKTNTNVITVNLSKDNLKDVLKNPLFENCTLTGYGAVTFHAEGTDQEEKCRPIDDFDFVVTSPEQFDTFVIKANNNPNVSKKTEKSLGTDKNGKICSFFYKIADNQFVEMSVVLPSNNNTATNTNTKKLYNVKVKTLTELKKDKTRSQGLTKDHVRENSPTNYQIRNNSQSKYYKKNEKEQKDIEQINIINNLLKQEEESEQSNV